MAEAKEGSLLDSVVNWIMGGKKTKPIRTPGPMDPRPQDNTMVRAAAEEAAKRARERNEIAPETKQVLTGPVGAKGK